MYKIYDVSGKMVGDKWEWTQFLNWSQLKSSGYQGVYIMTRKNAHDNPYIANLYNEARSNAMRVGFYIALEEGAESYAVQMIDLGQKSKARSVSLPPAVVLENIPAGKTPHQFRGDFESYFNNFMVQKFDNVVIGLNLANKSWIFTPFSTDDVESFKALMIQDKVKLWLFDWSPPMGSPAPWTKVFIWGAGLHENLVEFETDDTTDDPVDDTNDTPLTLEQKLDEVLRILNTHFK